MAKRPYRTCQKCGTLVSMQTDTCTCGTYVGSQVPVMMDTSETLQEQLHNQSEETKYVQRCPNCGKDFFSASSNERLESCPNCGNRRIRFVEPVSLKKEESKEEEPAVYEQQENQTEDKQTVQVNSWGQLLEKLEEVDKEEHQLQLETVGRFAGYQMELRWQGESIVVGREANFAEYLRYDARVSGTHCSFTYKDGDWYVKDEKSTNSTLLNEREVSAQKAERIQAGDSIVLGNQMDSMEVKVVALK